MRGSIPSFSAADVKETLRGLENRWTNTETNDFIFRRLSEIIEEKEKKKQERLSRYLTAEELCQQSGLTEEELDMLKKYRLLVPDTKNGRYRPKLVGRGKKLKDKLSNGWTCEEIKTWTKERWKSQE